mgnify:CR=1 FL=1
MYVQREETQNQSSIMTFKQGVQNLLCHYVHEVKKVEAI